MAKWLIGIDEAGRGPLAGPVAVGVICLKNVKHRMFNILELFPDGKIRDSKKLSAKKREKIFNQIQEFKKDNKLDFAVTLVSNKIIDQQGIGAAIRHGISENLKKINLAPKICRVLLDGGLKAPAEYPTQETIIRGDESEPVIALASIVAKVIRDRWLVNLAKKYPNYGLERHKGYGTRAHFAALTQHGLSPIHRRTFCRKVLTK